MIALFTDFGVTGPYVGQMMAALYVRAPRIPVVNLMADAPAFNPRASAYLLEALVEAFPAGTVFLCVVDPGVGTARRPLALCADGRWFVGPDNGLLDVVVHRADTVNVQEVLWRPENLSDSFHGRDLFAPIAAMIANDESFAARPISTFQPELADDLSEVIYTDHYGNVMTGLRAAGMSTACRLIAPNGERVCYARTFGCVPPDTLFWYGNSVGLVEIAINQGRASERLQLGIGSPILIEA